MKMTYHTGGCAKMAEGRVVILGARGMLGTDTALLCQQKGINAKVLDLPEFDITNARHITEALKNARAVINCAAYTDVEKAQSQADLAYKVNAQAVGQLGAIAKQMGIWVLHISTDFVFDGKLDRPYVETDSTNPINTYGAGKLAGERLLVETGCRNCIMRVQWTYGRNGNNFVTKLVSLAKKGKKLKVVDDQIGSPTATTEVAKVICKLIDSTPEGLFHFANAGYASRFDVARFIFENLNMTVQLSSCKTSDYVTAAARPLNSCFGCGKIEALLDERIKPWQQPLEHFLKEAAFC